MFSAILTLAFLQSRALPIVVLIGVIAVLVAAIALAIYLRKRVKKVEKEADEQWTSTISTLFTEPLPTAQPLEEPRAEEVEPVAAQESAPVEPTVTREFASEMQPEVSRDESAPAEQFDIGATREFRAADAPFVEMPVAAEGPPVAQEPQIEESRAEPQSEERATQILASPAVESAGALTEAVDEAALFDEEVWSQLETGEPVESTQPSTEQPVESPQMPEAAELRQTIELHSVARVEQRTAREPFEPPRIEPLTPRERTALISEQSAQAEPPQSQQTQMLASPPTPVAGSEPADYAATTHFASPEIPTAPPARASVEVVGARRPAGSILGLPVESTNKPLVMGVPLPAEEVGIGGLSRYGKRPKEKTSKVGTVIFVVVILALAAVVAALFIPWSRNYRPDDGKVKARIMTFDPIIRSDGTAKASGTVDNVSKETLEGLKLEVEIQRKDKTIIETRTVDVTPSTLEPNKTGKFEFEFPTDGNVATFSITKLMTKDRQIRFASPEQK